MSTARPASLWVRCWHVLQIAIVAWRTPLVTVDDVELAELQAAAARIPLLQAETLVALRESAALRAGIREDGVGVEELPLTTAGELHEEAFLALLDARVWAARQERLQVLTGPTPADTSEESR